MESQFQVTSKFQLDYPNLLRICSYQLLPWTAWRSIARPWTADQATAWWNGWSMGDGATAPPGNRRAVGDGVTEGSRPWASPVQRQGRRAGGDRQPRPPTAAAVPRLPSLQRIVDAGGGADGGRRRRGGADGSPAGTERRRGRDSRSP